MDFNQPFINKNGDPSQSIPPMNGYQGMNSVTCEPRFVHFQEFLADWKKSQPDNCCICLDSNPGAGNDLLFCASINCDVCVHQECFGVKVSPSLDEAWYCDRCRSIDSHTAFCKLCPVKRGALKKLMDGTAWVHVVCALWWPQVQVEDSAGLEITSIKDIPLESFSQSCDLCENRQDALVGACVKCDHIGCNKRFHITCAQEWDLLEESTDISELKPGQEPYYVYCKDHGRNQNPRMNPWALWSRKKDIYYESLCKNNMELVQSVRERERPMPSSRERRKSVQFNGVVLPPITSFNPLNLLLEAANGVEGDLPEQNTLITKFEAAYSVYNKERAEFVAATDQVHSRQLAILDRLNQKTFLSAQKASKLQKEQQDLEQENRDLQLEVSELKYGLLNLCSVKGLRMIQKIMGRPRHGLEFYPHQDMILDYFLEVSRHILNSESEDKSFPSRSCICGICVHVVDFSTSTLACSVCNSWFHIRCIPISSRPTDCNKVWICSGCLSNDPLKPQIIVNGESPPGKSFEVRLNSNVKVRASSAGPQEQESKSSATLKPQSPFIGSVSSKKRPGEMEYTTKVYTHSNKTSRSQSRADPTRSPSVINKSDLNPEEKPLIPYQQSPRFAGDEYTPRWVRGVGKGKEGLCPHCTDREAWLKIKISAYWYHLNYQHGISSITGKKFRSPLEYRINPDTDHREALCHKCNNWINSDSPRNKPVLVEEIYWWKHAQKCHQ